MTPLDRAAHAILVPSAGSTAGIGIIRSLGAAGYRVHAAAPDPGALGLRSRFAFEGVVHPPGGSPRFAEWLSDYVKTRQITMIMPGWGTNLFRQPALSHLAGLVPVSRDPAVLDPGESKTALFLRLLEGTESCRENLPPLVAIDFDQPGYCLRDLSHLPVPLFIKLDSALARERAGDEVIRVADATEARARLKIIAAQYHKAIVQGYVAGRGAGAFFLRWGGRNVARMMHLRLHEMPHTGGASSLRRSWWHQAMMLDAELKLAHLGWQGVAMVEYRWDAPSDRFYLMEMNLRFWGSLHLALYAGVDFPQLLADAFLFDRLPENVVEAKRAVICRNTFPFELGYLASLFRDPQVTLARKAYAAIEAVALSFDPRIRSDLFFPGDRLLYFERIRDLFKGMRNPSGAAG
jgi:hypothetical protein